MKLETEASELARIAVFGHAPTCQSRGRSSKQPDDLDLSCNLCRQVDRVQRCLGERE